MAAIIRQDIIKYITDRPGELVSKQDIMDAGGWTATQVTHSVLKVQQTTTLGAEIETVVRGNAWRYVPRNGTTANATTVQSAADLSLPVTTLIRQFFIANAHKVVTVEQLVAYTRKRIDQVKVGVNNMRNIASNADVSAHVHVVVHGQMWRFEPPPNWRPGVGIRPITTGRPSTAQTYVPPVVEQTSNGRVTVPDVTLDDQGRVFEEVGQLRDGRIVIRDQNGDMYAATPIRSTQEQ